jgi:hypothetical protein
MENFRMITEYERPLNSWECYTPDMTFLNCQACADEFARENGLDIGGGKDPYADNPAGYGVSACYACGHESDYPPACDGCGAYLEGNLTQEGQDYMIERLTEWPEWLVAYYLGEGYLMQRSRQLEAETSSHQVFSGGLLVGYHTRLGGLYVCIVCGHLCECQEEGIEE